MENAARRAGLGPAWRQTLNVHPLTSMHPNLRRPLRNGSNSSRGRDLRPRPLGATATLLTYLLLACAIALAFASLSAGRSAPGTLPVSSVRPGMKGFGLTVFRGTEPERFDVEVIDVLYRFRPGQDLILIRTPHPRLNEAQAVAGMSGSPIYLEGKLVGAYAYGWPFGTEPIVGVTPIHDMLAELQRPLVEGIWEMLGPVPRAAASAPRSRPPGRSRRRGPVAARPLLPNHRSARASSTDLPAYRGEQRHDALWAVRQLRAQQQEGQPGQAEAAQTPLMMAGLSTETLGLLSRELESFGMLAVQAGGSGPAPSAETSHASYRDGAAIGVQLIRGDVSATAVGTVTHVTGHRLVAFGHPMMNVGQTAMPTTTAEVVHILANQRRSFKMSRPVRAKGTLVQDRQAAVVVDAERTPETIPVRIRLHGPALPRLSSHPSPKTEWELELASNRNLTPLLLFSGLMNALQAVASDRTDVVFRAQQRVSIAGHGTLELTDQGHLLGGVATSTTLAQLRVFSAIDAAYGNPFERAHVTELEIDLSLSYADDVLEIAALRVPYAEAEPGSELPVHVTFRTYNGAEQRKTIGVPIPHSAAGQTVVIEANAGADVLPPLPIARNLDDLLDNVKYGYPASSLIIGVKLPSQGIRVEGHVAEQLPESVLNALRTETADTPSQLFDDRRRLALPMPQVLYGSAQVQVQVKDTSSL